MRTGNPAHPAEAAAKHCHDRSAPRGQVPTDCCATPSLGSLAPEHTRHSHPRHAWQALGTLLDIKHCTRRSASADPRVHTLHRFIHDSLLIKPPCLPSRKTPRSTHTGCKLPAAPISCTLKLGRQRTAQLLPAATTTHPHTGAICFSLMHRRDRKTYQGLLPAEFSSPLSPCAPPRLNGAGAGCRHL